MIVKSNLNTFLEELLPGFGEGTELQEIETTRPRENKYMRIITPTGRFIGKEFLTYRSNGRLRAVRGKMSKDPAEFEYLLLNLYKTAGAHVPSPSVYHSGKNILIMQDLGEDTLEKRLSEADKKTREELLQATLQETVNLHNAARESQTSLLSKLPSNIIIGLSKFDRRVADYFGILHFSDDELREGKKYKPERKGRHFVNLFKAVTENIYGESQLIHGDLDTYHVMFRPNDKSNKEEVWFIDFGSPKFLPAAFDVADLVFSPGVNLPIDKVMELYDDYVEKDRLKFTTGFFQKVAKDLLIEERRRLCFTGIFESLRFAAKSKLRRVTTPRGFEVYARRHPLYANPIPHYQKVTGELIDYLVKNADKYRIESSVERLEELKPELDYYISRGREARELSAEETRVIEGLNGETDSEEHDTGVEKNIKTGTCN